MPDMVLVKLMKWDDTYYKFVMAETMLGTPEMQNLRKMAHAHDFRLDLERLNTIEQTEKFLMMYENEKD